MRITWSVNSTPPLFYIPWIIWHDMMSKRWAWKVVRRPNVALFWGLPVEHDSSPSTEGVFGKIIKGRERCVMSWHRDINVLNCPPAAAQRRDGVALERYSVMLLQVSWEKEFYSFYACFFVSQSYFMPKLTPSTCQKKSISHTVKLEVIKKKEGKGNTFRTWDWAGRVSSEEDMEEQGCH